MMRVVICYKDESGANLSFTEDKVSYGGDCLVQPTVKDLEEPQSPSKDLEDQEDPQLKGKERESTSESSATPGKAQLTDKGKGREPTLESSATLRKKRKFQNPFDKFRENNDEALWKERIRSEKH